MRIAGALAGTGLPVSAGAPAAESTLWEGSPSLLLLLGPVLSMVVVALVVLVLGLVALPALLTALGAGARGSWVDQRQVPVILAVVLVAYFTVRGLRIALRAARLRSTRYRLTNQRIMVESGVVSRGLTEIDLRSVEDLVFRQGLVDRLLGIGTVSVVSSDRTVPRLLLLGVKDPRGTRELIRTQAYAATQRQLFTRST